MLTMTRKARVERKAEKPEAEPEKKLVKPRNEIAIAWIRRILDEADINGSELARRSGLVESTVLRMLNDEHHRFSPALKTLQKISAGMNISIPHEVFQGYGTVAMPIAGGTVRLMDEAKTPVTSKAAKPAKSGETAVEARQVHLPATVERLTVRHISSLPATLHPAIRESATVASPPQLAGDGTAFAFYMPDNALAPFVSGGTLMYGSQQRDPVVGDIVLVTMNDGRSRVRSLKDFIEDGILLSRPGAAFDAEDEVVPFEEIGQIAVVAGVWKL